MRHGQDRGELRYSAASSPIQWKNASADVCERVVVFNGQYRADDMPGWSEN